MKLPKIERSLLLTRVGRRMAGLFALCALLPVLLLAAIAILRGSLQLQNEAEERLHDDAKARAMRIAERLFVLDRELADLAAVLQSSPELVLQFDSQGWENRFAGRVSGVGIQASSGEWVTLWGSMLPPPAIDDPRHDHLFGAGRAVLELLTADSEVVALLLGRAVAPSDPEQGILWAVLEEQPLWFGMDGGDTPGDRLLWILDPQGRFLYPRDDPTLELPAELVAALGRSVSNAQWRDEQQTWISGQFNLPTRHGYFARNLSIVLRQTRDQVLSPVSDFTRWVILVCLASMIVVGLLSLGQIRRSLVPLEQLRAGTSRIADRNFHQRVQITSGDEFEELGNAFNSMASRLGQQFTTLQTLHGIAGSGLSAQDTEAMAVKVLQGLGATFAQRTRALTILDAAKPNQGMTYYVPERSQERPHITSMTLAAEDRALLADATKVLDLGPPRDEHSFLAPLAASGCSNYLVLPLALAGELAAVLAVGFRGTPPRDVDAQRQLRQIAEQIAAALAHVRLFMHVQNLYRGTLRALSRTIDAKSKWTVGHSERVTRMAIRLARQLGLPEADVQIIDRGGQLHDIGKIGVPVAILDKPDKLTPEEWKIVESHTLIGERILEPIPGFEDVIPMVGQHHEWFNGEGYPRGLKGKEIHFHSRILAVADTFDALRSSRPYREAVSRGDVVGYILSKAGTQFDPVVIEAFRQVVPADAQQQAASPVMYL